MQCGVARAVGGALVVGHVVDPLLDIANEVATSIVAAAGNVGERWRREFAVLIERNGLSGDAAVTIKWAQEPLPDAGVRLAKEADAGVIAMAPTPRYPGAGSRHLGLPQIQRHFPVIGRPPLSFTHH
jgi:hypothetical protein